MRLRWGSERNACNASRQRKPPSPAEISNSGVDQDIFLGNIELRPAFRPMTRQNQLHRVFIRFGLPNKPVVFEAIRSNELLKFRDDIGRRTAFVDNDQKMQQLVYIHQSPQKTRTEKTLKSHERTVCRRPDAKYERSLPKIRRPKFRTERWNLATVSVSIFCLSDSILRMDCLEVRQSRRRYLIR